MMGIRSIFGKVVGAVTGVLPTLLKFKEAADLILRLVKIGITTNDKAKLMVAVEAGQDLAALLRNAADELDDVFEELANALDDSGDAGDDISGTEAVKIADEAADVPVAFVAIGEKVGDLAKKLADGVR